MSITAGRVIERALKRILVGGADASPEADETADALSDLNDFMLALEANGVRLGYTVVDNVSDIVTVPQGAVNGIIANLAVTVAPDYSAAISPALAEQAREGMRTLRRLGRNKVSTPYPTTLPQGSGNEGYNPSGWNDHFYLSGVSGVLSLAGNTLTTDIVTADTPVKINAYWTKVKSVGLICDVGGRITSNQTADTSVTATITLSATGTGAYTFRLMQNGVSVASDTETLSATPVDIAITKALTLEPSDYLELWVEADGHTVDLIVADGQFEVT